MLWLILLVSMPQHSKQETLVFDFTKNAHILLKSWYSINDVVMGGLSGGQIKADSQGFAIFSGTVRPDNFGGFASVRTDLASTYRGYQGIRLRIKTDGKIYQIRLKTDRNFDGVNYTAKITEKANQWKEVSIPFSEFTPVYRGRKVTGYPQLKSEDIKQFGFLISDKQFGEFQLAIEWVKFY